MVRQAHTYLVGAVSSVTLVSIAIAAFVLLVSAQVFRDWPIGTLGGGEQKSAVSDSDAVGGAAKPDVAAAKTVVPGSAANASPATTTTRAGATARRNARGPAGGTRADSTQPDVGASEIPSRGGEPVATIPSSGADTGSGSDPGSGSNQGTGSNPSSPAGSGAGSVGASDGTAQGGGSSSTAPSKPSSPSEPTAPAEPPPAKAPSTSAALTETVNGTVNSIDETVTGGALQESGVTGLTEEVVNGVAGPESVVGETVDGVGEVVGGLLGGNK